MESDDAAKSDALYSRPPWTPLEMTNADKEALQYFEPHVKPISENPEETVLLELPQRKFTLSDALTGTLVLGASGSGKTSGIGAYLARAYLRAGIGGLVLTSKYDEDDGDLQLWQRMAAECGREQDLLVVSDDGENRCNLLNYQISGPGHTYAHQILEWILTAFEVSQGDGRDGGDPIWKDAMETMLLNGILLLQCAHEEISLERLDEIIRSAPKTISEVDLPEKRTSSYCLKLIDLIEQEDDFQEERNSKNFKSALRYWTDSYPSLSPNTRTSVVFTFQSVFSKLAIDPYSSLFDSDTNFVPEDSIRGKIIIINLPINLFGKTGKMIQVMFKFAWQKAMLRRTKKYPPVFLWADECQCYAYSKDTDFQPMARSAGVCTVYMSQSLAKFRIELGHQVGDDYLNAMAACMSEKFFHRLADQDTQQWASDLFSKEIIRLRNQSDSTGRTEGSFEGENKGYQEGENAGRSSNYGQSPTSGRQSGTSEGRNWGENRGINEGTNEQSTEGWSETIEAKIQPGAFGELKHGRRENQFCTEAIFISRNQGLVRPAKVSFFQLIYQKTPRPSGRKPVSMIYQDHHSLNFCRASVLEANLTTDLKNRGLFEANPDRGYLPQITLIYSWEYPPLTEADIQPIRNIVQTNKDQNAQESQKRLDEEAARRRVEIQKHHLQQALQYFQEPEKLGKTHSNYTTWLILSVVICSIGVNTLLGILSLTPEYFTEWEPWRIFGFFTASVCGLFASALALACWIKRRPIIKITKKIYRYPLDLQDEAVSRVVNNMLIQVYILNSTCRLTLTACYAAVAAMSVTFLTPTLSYLGLLPAVFYGLLLQLTMLFPFTTLELKNLSAFKRNIYKFDIGFWMRLGASSAATLIGFLVFFFLEYFDLVGASPIAFPLPIPDHVDFYRGLIISLTVWTVCSAGIFLVLEHFIIRPHLDRFDFVKKHRALVSKRIETMELMSEGDLKSKRKAAKEWLRKPL
ncbi:type IV secretory system conjugative DNA transfer family protein [Cerasicoccus frondis]|uniref:type IV secretory system conjugative DNA transfer family protein n=1 Tax=Cerasicoccus frondis TaxID=490090 RepID=UPI002852B812|nr:type IV secretion system DNA-binding domain-containing protein [Cerasicoccus frondis]